MTMADAAEPKCALCQEPMVDLHDRARADGAHRECSLRGVVGGIGHLIGHDYWCVLRHDPDAGLSYRRSALLVDLYVARVGVEAAVGKPVEHELTEDG